MNESRLGVVHMIFTLLAWILPMLLPRPVLAQAAMVSGNVSAQTVSFEPAVNYPTGTLPISVAVGDFNGDGVQDLAVTNGNSNDISVLLGNGDGTFQAARTFAAGSYPWSVVVGDFNGDGMQDLAVANLRSFHVSVLLGNGDGTFQAARAFVVGFDPGSVAVGDFNGDDIEDLAVAYEGVVPAGGVSVLLGNGDGTFQAARYFVGPFARPYSVAVGDFNGDGVEDLAVVADLYNFSVLLGIGDGTFRPARNFFVGFNPWSLAVGDFNGDGKPDLS